MNQIENFGYSFAEAEKLLDHLSTKNNINDNNNNNNNINNNNNNNINSVNNNANHINHINQLLPLVRYWLPHVRIITPVAWQEELLAGLRQALAQWVR